MKNPIKKQIVKPTKVTILYLEIYSYCFKLTCVPITGQSKFIFKYLNN